MADPWNPTQYDKFKREREQPFLDLMAMVRPSPAMRIVDLGCGTGALTRQLHARLHAQQTLGLDRSSRMLEDARASELPPGLTFEVGDIGAFAADREYDLIFSNAAFHWIEDHEALIARLVIALRPGGQLLFQVPAMHDDPSHSAAEALTTVEPFASAFAGWHRPQPVLTPDGYARLIYRQGLAEPSGAAHRLSARPRPRRRGHRMDEGDAAHRLPAAPAGGAIPGVPGRLPSARARVAGRHDPLLFPVQSDTLLGSEMLKGTRDGLLKRVQPVSIHGQVSWDIFFTDVDDEGGQTHMARVGPEAVVGHNLEPGDRIQIEYVVGVPVKVTRVVPT